MASNAATRHGAGGDRPLSPPTSPSLLGDDDLKARSRNVSVDVDSEDDVRDTNCPSSPPTSVDAGTHHKPRPVQVDEVEDESNDPRSIRHSSTEAEDPELRLAREQFASQTFSSDDEAGDDGDDEGAWASDGATPKDPLQFPLGSPGSASHLSTPPSHVLTSRKSTPRLQPSRTPFVATKSALRFSRTVSAASSASYETREVRKAPLVLLHVNLLLLPGVEEHVLKRLTPTTLERGLLIEHPRGDYPMLEELILDGLGLDDEEESDDDDDVASDAAEWAKSLGVRKLPGRRKWEVRVYASNGLMTQGAWRRVWTDMERVDVEVAPKGSIRKTRRSVSQALISTVSGFSGGLRSAALRSSRAAATAPRRLLPRFKAGAAVETIKGWPWVKVLKAMLVLALGLLLGAGVHLGWGADVVNSVAEWRRSYENAIWEKDQAMPTVFDELDIADGLEEDNLDQDVVVEVSGILDDSEESLSSEDAEASEIADDDTATATGADTEQTPARSRKWWQSWDGVMEQIRGVSDDAAETANGPVDLSLDLDELEVSAATDDAGADTQPATEAEAASEGEGEVVEEEAGLDDIQEL